jgi:alpha-1,2-mannosyltransferase
MSDMGRVIVTSVLLAASVTTTALSLILLPFDDTRSGQPLIAWTAALWVLFALSVVVLRKVPQRAAVVLVLVGSVAIGGAALAGPPNTSTDSARYAWDGIVQHAGISPYAHVPADPALEGLRPAWLFPESCDGSRIMTFTTSDGTLCTAINRATVPTIYPPMAEIYYLAVRSVVPTDVAYLPLQVAGLLVSLAVTALLLRTLLRRGRDPRWAALWGWCPLVATEAVTNSHVDAVAALLLLLATVLVASKRRWLGGIALGLSIATKLIPVIGAPPLLRFARGGGWWKVTIGAVAAFALLYVPYVAASGIKVLGFLPGYLDQEGYGTGKRFILLTAVLPGSIATVVAALIILATAILVWLRANPDNPWLGEVILIGVVLLTVSPRYAWYALLLVPMIAMTGRWEWLAVPLALTERLLVPSVALGRISIILAIVVIAGMAVWRMGPDARVSAAERVRHPFSRPAKSTPVGVTER